MKRSKKNSDAESQLEQLEVIVAQQNLIHYIRLGDTNVVKLLLMAGLNPNAVYQNDKTKWYPLHHSIKSNQLECTRLLLKNGANVNLQDENKQTALFDAIKTGNIDAVKLLIEFGADLNHKGEDKIKPLLYAQKQKKLEIYNLLKESGAEEMSPKEMKAYKIISNTKLVLGYVIVAGILSFIIFMVYGVFFRSDDNSSNSNTTENNKSQYSLNGVCFNIDISNKKDSDGEYAASEACQWINLWKMADGGYYKDGSYLDGIGRLNGVREDGDLHLERLQKYLSDFSKKNSVEKNKFIDDFINAYKSCPNNLNGTIPPIVKRKFFDYGLILK